MPVPVLKLTGNPKKSVLLSNSFKFKTVLVTACRVDTSMTIQFIHFFISKNSLR